MPFLPWRDDNGDLLQLEYTGSVPTREQLPYLIEVAREKKRREVNPLGETGVQLEDTFLGPEEVPKDALGNPDLTGVRNIKTALTLGLDPVTTSFGPEAPKQLLEGIAGPGPEEQPVGPKWMQAGEAAARGLVEKALPIASSPVTAFFSVPGVATSALGRAATGAFGVGAAKAGGEELGTALALHDEGKDWLDPEVAKTLAGSFADLALAPVMLGHAAAPGAAYLKANVPDLPVGEAARRGIGAVKDFEARLTPELSPEAGVVKFGKGSEDLPPVPEGFVRLWRGGEGSNFFTPVEERAGSFANERGEGSYVDVPREVYEAGKADAAQHGQPTPEDTYLPDEWVKKAQPTRLKQDIYDLQDTGESVEDILKSLEVEDLPGSPNAVQSSSAEGGPGPIPEVPPPGAPERNTARMNGILEGQPGEPAGAARISTEPDAIDALAERWKQEGFTHELADDMENFESMTPGEAQKLIAKVPDMADEFPWIRERATQGAPPVEPAPNQAEVDAAHEAQLTPPPFRWDEGRKDWIWDQPKPWSEPIRYNTNIDELQAMKEGIIKSGATEDSVVNAQPFYGSDATRRPVSDILHDIDEQIQKITERKTSPEAAPVIKPEETPALEAQPKPKSFNEFMTQKFGDRPTSAKERALARAEWQQVKDERHIMKLAEKAGIPPDKLKGLLEGMPKPSEEANNLAAWRRAALPVVDNLRKVHPWLGEAFDRYVADSERPASKLIADSYRIKHALSHAEQREVVDILEAKKSFDQASSPKVAQAAGHYRQMLDTVWNDALSANVVKGAKRQNYFPHKFAEGWDDNLLRMPQLDKNWNLRDPHLEKSRMTKRGDYRKDLGVLDEYFLSAYRRIAEVQNFGKRLEVLRRFLRKMPMNKATSDWLHTNIRRVMGREAAGTFDIISGHARHLQALSDLGLAGFYQPIQGVNTAIYGGLGRSARALMRIVKDYPNETYDAMRSGALMPSITQEVIQGAYGASEGIRSPALQKFMYGIPTIDKWTRIHANTVGKMMVEDALKGNKSVLKDIHTLVGKDFKLDDPHAYDLVGKALSDKALFRTGTLEVPGWASSGYGKLATQYCRFMYRHSVFVSGIFKEAATGNVRPLARFLVAAGTVIPGMAEALWPVREGIRNAIKQGVSGQVDTEKLKREAIGDPRAWNTEVAWSDILKNKRIPWSDPLKRYLQNLTLWGGLGVFQIMVERASRGGGAFERGARALVGPVPANAYELVGGVPPDIERMSEGEGPRYVPRWFLQQFPLAGYPLASEAFPPVGSYSRHRRSRSRRR